MKTKNNEPRFGFKKLHKKGKTWIALGAAFGALSLGAIFGGQTIWADENIDSASSTQVVAAKSESALSPDLQTKIEKVSEVIKTQDKKVATVYAGLADDKAVSEVIKGLKAPDIKTLNADGYIIKGGVIDGKKVVAIQGTNENGLAYALNQVINQLNGIKDFSTVNVVESPKMAIRGVIEGFYGWPWTDQARTDMFEFMGEHRMNTYIYSPKDDEYARNKWRDLYPEQELARLKNLVSEAAKNNVAFVYALSPGNDITYSTIDDYNATIKKFEQLKSIGVKQFYIALDDISPYLNDVDKKVFKNKPTPNYPKNGWSALAEAQAIYINYIQKEFVKKNNLPDLWLVPTNYSGSAQDPFKEAQGLYLDKNIRVQWTGEGVFSEKVTADSIKKANKTYNTEHLFIWDNFPVNDSDQDRLFLQPLAGRGSDLHLYTDGFTTNPMIEPYASWSAIAGYADYSWNPETFDTNQTQTNVINELAGEDEHTQAVLSAFFDLNQSWESHISAANDTKAPTLSKLVRDYNSAKVAGVNTKAYAKAKESLVAQLDLIVEAPDTLQKMAQTGFYDDAKPWLTVGKQWALAMKDSISLFEDLGSKNPDLAKVGTTYDQLNSHLEAAHQKLIVDMRKYTSRDESAPKTIVPKIGDGVFDSFTNNAVTAVNAWLGGLDLTDSAKPKTGKGTGSFTTHYENNVIENIADGDEVTRFWSDRNVKKGDTLTLDFGKKTAVQKIVLKQGANDKATGDIFGKAHFEGTSDGKTWKNLGEVSQAGVAQVMLSAPEEFTAIRVVADEDTAGWLQVRELMAYGKSNYSTSNIVDKNETNVQNAFDNNLTTKFDGSLKDNKQGEVQKMFDKGLEADTVFVAGNVEGDVQLQTNGSWKTVGSVKKGSSLTKIDVNKAKYTGVRVLVKAGSADFSISEIGLSLNDNSKPTDPEKPTSIKAVGTIDYVPGYGVLLRDKNGNVPETNKQYLKHGTNWKINAKKMINGELFYRLGNDNQWVQAKYIILGSKEKPMSAVIKIQYKKNYGVLLKNQFGKVPAVKKYLKHGTNWKVFAKKTINGHEYYRLGNNNQWIETKYAKIK